MSLRQDAAVLWHLLRGQAGEGSHAERLNDFYAPQADRYDQFRERLLQGRRELLEELSVQLRDGDRLVELGAGTGRNLAFLGSRVDALERVELVDLCAPLLHQARQRWQGHENVFLVEADATRYQPAEPVDAVYFSYSLSMIPDWFAAVDNALTMLRPGGVLGVVDFYVSRPHPPVGRVRHGGLTRHFWPLWFAHDGVYPSKDHLPYLGSRLELLSLAEERARVPYLPGLRVPYYRFIGRKRKRLPILSSSRHQLVI